MGRLHCPVELVFRKDPFLRNGIEYIYETYPLKRPVKMVDFYPQFTRITSFMCKSASYADMSRYRYRVKEGKTQIG